MILIQPTLTLDQYINPVQNEFKDLNHIYRVIG